MSFQPQRYDKARTREAMKRCSPKCPAPHLHNLQSREGDQRYSGPHTMPIDNQSKYRLLVFVELSDSIERKCWWSSCYGMRQLQDQQRELCGIDKMDGLLSKGLNGKCDAKMQCDQRLSNELPVIFNKAH